MGGVTDGSSQRWPLAFLIWENVKVEPLRWHVPPGQQHDLNKSPGVVFWNKVNNVFSPIKYNSPLIAVSTWEASPHSYQNDSFKWTLFPVTHKAGHFLRSTHLSLIKPLRCTSELRLPLSRTSLWSLILLPTHFLQSSQFLVPPEQPGSGSASISSVLNSFLQGVQSIWTFQNHLASITSKHCS